MNFKEFCEQDHIEKILPYLPISIEDDGKNLEKIFLYHLRRRVGGNIININLYESFENYTLTNFIDILKLGDHVIAVKFLNQIVEQNDSIIRFYKEYKTYINSPLVLFVIHFVSVDEKITFWVVKDDRIVKNKKMMF